VNSHVSELIDALQSAQGEQQSVIAVFIDVRGFTRFAGIADSFDTAVFLKKFYIAVLQSYLPGAQFAKPSGDGLMLIFEHSEAGLETLAKMVLGGCISLIEEYPAFLYDDKMIIFDLPPNLGIGVARGAATRLAADSTIIDYTGRCLNLAARLMNFARPRGLVVDAKFLHGMKELSDTLSFAPESVYIAGLTTEDPWPVLIRKEWTQIEDRHRAQPTTDGRRHG